MVKRTLTGAGITLIVYLVVAFSHIPAVIACAAAVLSGFAVYEIYSAAGFAHNPQLLWGSIAAAVMIAELPVQNFDTVCVRCSFADRIF